MCWQRIHEGAQISVPSLGCDKAYERLETLSLPVEVVRASVVGIAPVGVVFVPVESEVCEPGEVKGEALKLDSTLGVSEPYVCTPLESP